MLVCSAPQFPHGVIDPVQEVAQVTAVGLALPTLQAYLIYQKYLNFICLAEKKLYIQLYDNQPTSQ